VFNVTQQKSGASKGLTTFALKLGAFKGAPDITQCRACRRRRRL